MPSVFSDLFNIILTALWELLDSNDNEHGVFEGFAQRITAFDENIQEYYF